MKKEKYIKYVVMTIFLILILTTGCHSNKNNLSLEKDAKNKGRNIVEINCPEFQDNSEFIYRDFFINDNKIYQFSSKKFKSNNKNCKLVYQFPEDEKIELSFAKANSLTNEKFYLKTSNNNVYTYNVTQFNGMNQIDINTIQKCDNPMSDSYIKSVLNEKFEDNVHYYSYEEFLVYRNNELQRYIIKFNPHEDNDYNDNRYILKKSKNINISEIKDEKIIKIEDRYVKTNKAYYDIKKVKTNKAECEKYADVKCNYEYKLVKNKKLSKYYNDIKYIFNFNVVTKNNKIILP